MVAEVHCELLMLLLEDSEGSTVSRKAVPLGRMLGFPRLENVPHSRSGCRRLDRHTVGVREGYSVPGIQESRPITLNKNIFLIDK